MKRLGYILFAWILFIESILSSYAYSETEITTDKNLKFTHSQEDSVETQKEILIKKDEFDEIVGQLQGMKTLMEKMKQDYDTRFQELQEKIATLEKEKTELKEERAGREGNKQKVVKDDSKNGSISDIKENDTLYSQVDEVTKDSLSSQNSPITQQGEVKVTALPSLNSAPAEQQAGASGNVPIPFPTSTNVAEQTTSSSAGQWSPAQPLALWSSGKNYMNISFDGLFAAGGSTVKDLENLETGGHDPLQRGFTVQNLETVFEGAIDPYFKGQSNIVFQIDKEGESFVEVEEAYLTSMSLPMNLQVKAGTFFTEFGRLNPFHPHAWDFADQPLVNGRFLGPDGLRNPGARISWLAPTDNYTELFFTVQDSQGETAHSFRFEEKDMGLFGRTAVNTGVRNMGDLLYVPHVATSFDLTDEQTILLGASAAFGPNSTGPDENTLIYGLDMFWKWKSNYASGGFPFVTWQTEVMGRRFEAGADIEANLPAEVMNNWGAYSQVGWGFKKRWVVALRGDYVDGEEGATYTSDFLGFERWRLSPNLTFYPSEFSKIRLQYNYDDILGNDSTEHSVFLQFEFLLGSHGAHKF